MNTSTVTRRAWGSTVQPIQGDAAQQLKMSPAAGTAQLPLITRTGFELRHIFTSQIASL